MHLWCDCGTCLFFPIEKYLNILEYYNIKMSQAKVGAIVEKKQGTAKTYFNTSDMR